MKKSDVSSETDVRGNLSGARSKLKQPNRSYETKAQPRTASNGL